MFPELKANKKYYKNFSILKCHLAISLMVPHRFYFSWNILNKYFDFEISLFTDIDPRMKTLLMIRLRVSIVSYLNQDLIQENDFIFFLNRQLNDSLIC